MQKIRPVASLTLASIVVALAGTGTRADEIRWVNPAGGDWNNPANWDLGRVPADLDKVIFDLDASYSVGFCGAAAASLDSVKIDNSTIAFDLCGGTLFTQPGVDDEFPHTLRIGTDASSETHVSFANGTVFGYDSESLIYEPEIGVGAAGMPASSLVVEATAEVGSLSALVTQGASSLTIHGDVGLYDYASVNILGGLVVVDGDMQGLFGSVESVSVLVGSASQLELGGTLDASESSITGSGTVRVLDGGSVAMEGNGVAFILEGDAWVWGSEFAGCSFDLRAAANASPSIYLNQYAAGPIGGPASSIVYGPGNIAQPPQTSVNTEFGKSEHAIRGEIRFESDETVVVGESHLVGIWDLDVLSEDQQLNTTMVAEVAGPNEAILRWGVIGPSDFGVYVLGVPADWCPADLDFNGQVNFFDIARFVTEYSAGSPWANVREDFVLNFFDVSDYIARFNAGCP
jgi:hypothetical protein